MSIVAVAELAQVSISTVSRVLNGTAKVNPETAERVHRAIKKLKFHPDRNARAMGSGRSGLYGLIISDITNPYFPELMKSFEDIASEHGQDVLVANTDYDPKRMEECVVRMLQRKVDGVAIMTSEMEDHLLTSFSSRKIPLVFMDLVAPRHGMSSVRIDYASGVHAAIAYLVSLGHKRIGFLSGPLGLASARLRKEAFRAAIQEHGVSTNEQFLQEGDHRVEGGRFAMQRILSGRSKPTAVLASNDLTAIGAMSAIHDAGLRIPNDISIIGIDDIALSAYTYPPLTTLKVSRRELAVAAFQCIYSGGTRPGVVRPSSGEHVIQTHLEVRASCGPPYSSRPL